MGTPRRPGRGPAGRVLAGLLLVLGIAAAGGSRLLHDRDVEAAREAAEDGAVEYADAVLGPHLTTTLVSGPITGADQDELLAAVGRSIRSDAVARVRIWSPQGALLFSTDKLDAARTEPGPEVRAAARGSGTISSGEERVDVGKAGEPLYRTLIPMRVGSDPAGAIVQVDQRLAAIDEEAREPAATVQTAGYAVAALGLLLGLVWIVRGRTGKGRAGGFQPATAGPAVPQEAGALEERLDKAEAAREAVEQQLAQLRSQIEHGSAPDAERTKALETHLRETEERARELEGRLRDADARLQESDRVAKEAVQRAEEAEARAVAAVAASPGQTLDDPRVPQLEAELAAALAELQAAREAVEVTPGPEGSSAELEELRSQAERAEQRVAELEQLRAADQQRLAASADVTERSTLRIRELEGKLEGSSLDREAMVSRVRELETKLADVERRSNEETTAVSDAAARATQAEAAAAAADVRATTAEQRLAETESRVETLQELVRSAEERAATAGLRADELERRLADVTQELERTRETIQTSAGVGAEQARRVEDADARAREASRRVAELEGELEAARIGLEAAAARASAQEAKLEDLTGRARAADAEIAQAEAAATEGAARARELDQALRELNGRLDAARLAADAAEARAVEATARAEAAEEQALATRTELEEVRSELAIAQARRDPATAVPPPGPGAAAGSIPPDVERLRSDLDHVRAESAARVAELEGELSELRQRSEGADARLRQAYAEVEATKAELDVARSTPVASGPPTEADDASAPPGLDPPVAAPSPADNERLLADLAAAVARADAAERRVGEMEARLASGADPGPPRDADAAKDARPAPATEGEPRDDADPPVDPDLDPEAEEGPSLRYRLARSAQMKKQSRVRDPDHTRS